MDRLALRLGQPAPLLLDGGLGTMLLARGLERGSPPERWSLERPDEVLAIHRAYVEAGSEAVHTNTFGASPIRLGAFRLAERALETNRRGVELARAAGASFVVGDVGPTGEYLPPVGKGDETAWRASFRDQGRWLAEAGVDAFHVETMSDLREARIALDALGEVAPDVPVLVSLTFERKKRGFFTVMGHSPATALVELGRAGAAAVGANCSVTSRDMLALADEALGALRSAGLSTPLVVQPNAGQPRLVADGLVYDQTPEEFAADVAAMARAGARLCGGCCGTDPRFIAALRAELQRAGH